MLLLNIKKEIILKLISLTIGFIDKKNVATILSNIYIKKHNNRLTAIANDVDIQASIDLEYTYESDDFIITVPGKKFYDILRMMPDNADIILEQDNSRITIKSGKSKFTVQSLPAEQYPLIKINSELKSQIVIAQNILKKAIYQTQYAMADKDSRVFLNAMYFEIKENILFLVATDANRLTKTSIAITHNNQDLASMVDHSVIIPRKTILELSKFLDDSDSSMTINFYNNQVSFTTTNKQLITKIIDAKYPNYEKVIPNDNTKLCLLNKEALLRAVERVSVIGIDDLKTITLDIENNLLKVSCKNKEQEESYDELEVRYTDEAIKINFNLLYIKEMLVHCQSELVQLAFFDNRRSVLITLPNVDDFKSVIMPIRTQ